MMFKIIKYQHIFYNFAKCNRMPEIGMKLNNADNFVKIQRGLLKSEFRISNLHSKVTRKISNLKLQRGQLN